MLLSYFFLQNAWNFSDRGDALWWAASVSLSPNEVQTKTNLFRKLSQKVSKAKSSMPYRILLILVTNL